MPLTDEKRKKLRELIQTTFTEQQLKDICTENEQRLKGNLYDVVEGTTYQSKLINLVRYLHQNDLINIFLTILSNENQNFAAQMQSFITQEDTSDQQNTNNIVSYLFFIIEPKTNKEFFIKAEFVQFANNNRQEELNRFYIELSEEQESQIYSDSQIIDVVYNTIEKMYIKLEQENIVLHCSLIIEFFVPISLLDIDLNKIPKKYGSHKVPIIKNYPLNMRFYDRFFKHKINDPSTVFYREKWKQFKQLIDQSHNTQEFIQTASNYVEVIEDSVTNLRQRQKIFSEILRKGFPLCLWTRYKYKNINQINEINNYLERILKIDDNHYPGYCKFYKILRNIHNITDYGYNLGVLFDHDKIPTGANQLISPNMSRKV